MLIQEQALGTDLGGRFVYVVGEGNIVERRYVTLGVVEPDGMVPILEGLDGSETYIVQGLLRARPGMPVTPEKVSDIDEAKAEAAVADEPEPEESAIDLKPGALDPPSEGEDG